MLKIPLKLPNFVALATCDPQGVIGNQGALPWHYPEDLRQFRRTTLNNIMIMGYKTFLEMPAASFEGRKSFVLTKKHRFDSPLVTPISDLQELLEKLQDHYALEKDNCKKINFVIGGEQIFELFFRHKWIQCAHITHLHKSYAGDTYFPLHYLASWQQELCAQTPTFSLVTYMERIGFEPMASTMPLLRSTN
jgi:dihydrofolate reductase